MITLDIRTFICILFLGNILFVVAYYAYMRFHIKEKYDELFVFGKLLQACAWALIGLKGFIHEYTSVFLGYSLLLVGVSMESWSFMALQHFHDKKIRLYYIVVVILGLLFWAEPFWNQPINFKILILSLAGAYVFFVPGFFYLESKNGSTLQKLIGCLYMFLSVATIFKGGQSCLSEEYRIFDATPLQIFFYIILFGAMGASITAYILLKNENLSKALKKAAITDELTGIYNRKGFYDIATKYCEKSIRDKESVAMLSVSIHQLKKINDQYGNEQGDKILQHFARAMSGTLRNYDLFCRHGGNEFIAFLPGTRHEHISNIIERFHDRIQQPSAKNTLQTDYAICTGIYCSIPSQKNPLDNFVHMSIRALDESTRRGKNTLVIIEHATGNFRQVAT